MLTRIRDEERGLAMVVALIAVVFALMVPLLPFAFVALCVWAIVRSSRPALVPYR